MKNTFILCAFLALSSFTVAQQSEKYPLGDYTELTDTKPHDSDEIWDKLSAPTQLSWDTTDIRYPKLSIPDVKKSNRWQTKAWKGERVNAQAVLWTKVGLEDASITVSDLKSGSSIIPSSAITTNFVRYVMTDELNKDRKGGCGHRENKAEWDSSVVADVLDIVKIRDIKARTTQPIWMNIWRGWKKQKSVTIENLEKNWDFLCSEKKDRDSRSSCLKVWRSKTLFWSTGVKFIQRTDTWKFLLRLC